MDPTVTFSSVRNINDCGRHAKEQVHRRRTVSTAGAPSPSLAAKEDDLGQRWSRKTQTVDKTRYPAETIPPVLQGEDAIIILNVATDVIDVHPIGNVAEIARDAIMWDTLCERAPGQQQYTVETFDSNQTDNDFRVSQPLLLLKQQYSVSRFLATRTTTVTP
uniref:Velvet domain-containing protein n=1 Tax=Steinernema glaseri TaxID=37863 RepID=A0A1I7ZIK2_9BILA